MIGWIGHDELLVRVVVLGLIVAGVIVVVRLARSSGPRQ